MNLWGAKLLILLAMVVPATQQQNPSANQGARGSAATTRAAEAPILRISAPLAGQQMASNFVVVRYEVTNPSATPEPNFRVQIDSADAITTRDTEYTFTGLAPGNHTVTVQIVDANGTPIQGGRAEVQFKVGNPTPAGAGTSSLPSGGSPLPMLSLIGFGVLIWQGFGAMRSRA